LTGTQKQQQQIESSGAALMDFDKVAIPSTNR